MAACFFSCFFFCVSNAQIQFVNPNMEGDTCIYFGQCIADNWTRCWVHEKMGLAASGQPLGVPKNAYEGTTFAVLGAFSPNSFGTMSQRLNCSLKKNCEYEFSFAGASFYIELGGSTIGKMQVFLNHDTCSENKLAYTSPYLDTVWGIYTARFTANDDYEWIQFRPLYEGTGMQLFLDALSPIRCLNAHEVNITGTKDTTVPASGSCVQLSAQTNLITYDSMYWIKLPADTFAHNQWNATVCPDTDAVYVVAIHDSTATCAGTWWSFDTVKVRVDKNNAIHTIQQGSTIQVFPNPSKQQVQIELTNEMAGGVLQVYDVNGRWVKRLTVSDKRMAIDVSDLPSALYVLVVSKSGLTARTKLFVE